MSGFEDLIVLLDRLTDLGAGVYTAYQGTQSKGMTKAVLVGAGSTAAVMSLIKMVKPEGIGLPWAQIGSLGISGAYTSYRAIRAPGLQKLPLLALGIGAAWKPVIAVGFMMDPLEL